MQKWKDDLVRTTGCYDVYPDIVDSCVNGDPNAPHRAVVVGDSVAMSYMPGIVKALAPQGLPHPAADQGPVPRVGRAASTSTVAARSTSCDRYRRWAAGVVDRQRPELAVLVTAYGTVSTGCRRERMEPMPTAEIRAGLARQHPSAAAAPPTVSWSLEPAPQVDHGLQELRGQVRAAG